MTAAGVRRSRMFGAAICIFAVFFGLWTAHGNHPAAARNVLLQLFVVAVCVGVALALFGPRGA